jgi:hypothetical protein
MFIFVHAKAIHERIQQNIKAKRKIHILHRQSADRGQGQLCL